MCVVGSAASRLVDERHEDLALGRVQRRVLAVEHLAVQAVLAIGPDHHLRRTGDREEVRCQDTHAHSHSHNHKHGHTSSPALVATFGTARGEWRAGRRRFQAISRKKERSSHCSACATDAAARCCHSRAICRAEAGWRVCVCECARENIRGRAHTSPRLRHDRESDPRQDLASVVGARDILEQEAVRDLALLRSVGAEVCQNQVACKIACLSELRSTRRQD